MGVRLRSGTGMLIVGGTLAAVGVLLPWFDMPGGVTTAGVESMAGVGALVLGLVAAAIGAFLLRRPGHPATRVMAWVALIASLGILGLALLAVSIAGPDGGTGATGLLLSVMGGVVATMGCRGLLTRY